eukprot:1169592-Alexandrium_andersonii.AAC.1
MPVVATGNLSCGSAMVPSLQQLVDPGELIDLGDNPRVLGGAAPLASCLARGAKAPTRRRVSPNVAIDRRAGSERQAGARRWARGARGHSS